MTEKYPLYCPMCLKFQMFHHHKDEDSFIFFAFRCEDCNYLHRIYRKNSKRKVQIEKLQKDREF